MLLPIGFNDGDTSFHRSLVETDHLVVRGVVFDKHLEHLFESVVWDMLKIYE